MNGKIPKSKESIRRAYLKIQKEKSFNDICVSDIVSEANVSRSTFYQYYDDKFQLLEEIENELTQGFINIMRQVRTSGRDYFIDGLVEGVYGPFVDYFRFLKDNHEAFQALCSKKSQTFFESRFINEIRKTRTETLSIWHMKDNSFGKMLNTKFWDNYLSSVYMSFFTAWIEAGMAIPEASMGKRLTTVWRTIFLSEIREYELPADRIKQMVRRSLKAIA